MIDQQNSRSDTAYEAPTFEVLGQLTDLAEGQGENGQLIVMQTGIPGGDGGATVIP